MIDTIFTIWIGVVGMDFFDLVFGVVLALAIFYPIIRRWLI
jgi:hypothetical protein